MSKQDDFLNRVIETKPLKVRPTKVADIDWPEIYAYADKIAVLPLEPQTKSAGGIEYDAKTVAAERAMTTVGQVKKIGSLCFTAVTKDGLDYGSEKHKFAVGSWIVYKKHAGQQLFVRQKGDGMQLESRSAPRYLLMTEDDVLAVFPTEEEARKVWAWCR